MDQNKAQNRLEMVPCDTFVPRTCQMDQKQNRRHAPPPYTASRHATPSSRQRGPPGDAPCPKSPKSMRYNSLVMPHRKWAFAFSQVDALLILAVIPSAASWGVITHTFGVFASGEHARGARGACEGRETHGKACVAMGHVARWGGSLRAAGCWVRGRVRENMGDNRESDCEVKGSDHGLPRQAV